jgi:hypothetical protein
VPEISRFFGIVVMMFWRDHGPPHFHVRYGGSKASLSIDTLSVIDGRLPPRALGLVIEWATLHRDDLVADWKRAERSERLIPIPPLE